MFRKFFLYKSSITGEATAAEAASIVASTEFMKNSPYRSHGESNIPDISRTTNRPVRLKLLDGLAVEIVPESKSIVFFPGQTYILLKQDIKEQE